MKRKILEILFVIAVFVVAYTVIIDKVSLTGFAISLDSYEEPRIESSNVEYKNLFVELKQDSSTSLNELEKGNIIVINQGQNKYNIVVMQIDQDYSNSNEIISLLVRPGEKRILLKESQSTNIDFNNDGKLDAVLIVRNIANNKATLILEAE